MKLKNEFRLRLLGELCEVTAEILRRKAKNIFEVERFRS